MGPVLPMGAGKAAERVGFCRAPGGERQSHAAVLVPARTVAAGAGVARRFWLLRGRSLALRAGASFLHWGFSPGAFNCLCPAVIGDWNSAAPTAQAVVEGKAEGRKRWESGPLPWV